MNLASFFGTAGDSVEPAPTPVPRPRRTPNKAEHAKILGAPPSPKPAVATPKPHLARNVAFDRKRIDAMRQVYEGQTKKAVTTFQDAQKLRPDDPSVKMWLDAIKQSAQKQRDAAPRAADDFRSATQQLRNPTMAAPGAVPGVVAPAGGGAPALPRPVPVHQPPQQEFDPALIF